MAHVEHVHCPGGAEPDTVAELCCHALCHRPPLRHRRALRFIAGCAVQRRLRPRQLALHLAPAQLWPSPRREGGSRTTAGWEPSALVGRSGAAADLWAWGLLGALPRSGRRSIWFSADHEYSCGLRGCLVREARAGGSAGSGRSEPHLRPGPGLGHRRLRDPRGPRARHAAAAAGAGTGQRCRGAVGCTVHRCPRRRARRGRRHIKELAADAAAAVSPALCADPGNLQLRHGACRIDLDVLR
mmetsp:Transcript_32652/g.78010  ORF Transcript_32652/g.78010 Transcript_32652/m.78010 type:complete len:242 (-) Transcript_32652:501-1226(-)